MLLYVLKRILSGLVTVFLIATITFAAMHLVPGNPLLGAKATTPEIQANLMAEYGLDKPVLVQYGHVPLEDGARATSASPSRSTTAGERHHRAALPGLRDPRHARRSSSRRSRASPSARSRRSSADACPIASVMFLAIVGISVPNFVFAALAQYGVAELNRWAGTGPARRRLGNVQAYDPAGHRARARDARACSLG